jgi:hypothetical protein
VWSVGARAEISTGMKFVYIQYTKFGVELARMVSRGLRRNQYQMKFVYNRYTKFGLALIGTHVICAGVVKLCLFVTW